MKKKVIKKVIKKESLKLKKIEIAKLDDLNTIKGGTNDDSWQCDTGGTWNG